MHAKKKKALRETEERKPIIIPEPKNLTRLEYLEQARPCRSDAYQYKLLESSASHILHSEDFAAGQGHQFFFPLPYDENETVLNLQDRLYARFWTIAKRELTEKQLRIILMLRAGYTQVEVAAWFGYSSQSTVAKSLWGAPILNARFKDKPYYGQYCGGSMKRLKALMAEDEIIQDLLRQIADAQEERWF